LDTSSTDTMCSCADVFKVSSERDPRKQPLAAQPDAC
jgi:hypothetical protein